MRSFHMILIHNMIQLLDADKNIRRQLPTVVYFYKASFTLRAILKFSVPIWHSLDARVIWHYRNCGNSNRGCYWFYHFDELMISRSDQHASTFPIFDTIFLLRLAYFYGYVTPLNLLMCNNLKNNDTDSKYP